MRNMTKKNIKSIIVPHVWGRLRYRNFCFFQIIFVILIPTALFSGGGLVSASKGDKYEQKKVSFSQLASLIVENI